MSEKLTRVQFTNLEKILYPELKITKAQVIEYYIRMAPKMLGFLADRPAVLTRFPDGIDKEGFYEKDAPMGTPAWVETYGKYSETSKRQINYVVCNNLDTLIWLANLAALEIHTTLTKTNSIENPDLVLFDIDPEPPADHVESVKVALLLKEKLDALGLRSYVKTSGKKGLHVVIPVVGGYTFEQTRQFVHQIAKQLTKESDIVVSEFARSKDPGTVFIDYRQNSHGRTMICPHSLRAVPQATVSTPLSWDSVKKRLKPAEFTLFTVVKMEDDPWKRLLEDRQKLEVV
ncbi:MAG TPA: non-homologous end-joining DNA ligase [Candidatus Bathyarchaeia archaeon]|nr:non-homologous end-joining DNA ligase [Candidatus Bathyarchaeia archaeon]